MRRLILPLVLMFSIGISGSFGQVALKPEIKEKIHQFDFWLGKWEVYKYGTDTLVAQSHIESIMDSVGLQENYDVGERGKYKGTSINKYNINKQQWEQYYVDNQGLTLHLTGGLQDGKMVLSNVMEVRGKKVFNQIAWELLVDGSVRQTWLQRSKEEDDWQTAFDGQYRRAK